MLPIHFAPLQGFTESAYRRAHFLHAGAAGRNTGIAAYYTPFLRVEKGAAREKDLRDLQQDLDFIKSKQTNTCHCENQAYETTIDSCCHSPLGSSCHSPLDGESNNFYNVIPQVICRDASEFSILVDAIQKLKRDCGFAPDEVFPQIDINMGCPFPMQAKSGRGSGILPRIDAVREIFAEAATHAPLKFSVKMRLGYTSPEECLALLPLLNEAPLAHITLHPRLGIQQYKGALDFDAFQKFYEGCRHPLIFNGDVTSVTDIERLEQKYPKLAGVMIGRGLLANPAFISGADPLPVLLQIHNALLADYRKRLQGDAQVLDKIRPFWTYAAEAAQDPSRDQPNIACYQPDIPKRTIKKIAKARNLNDYLNAVQELA